MERYHVIGTMSGTSLDGLDIAECTFELSSDLQWSFSINAATTVDYATSFQEKLKKSHQLNGRNLLLLHNELGNFIGEEVKRFITKHQINTERINAISSHGHTIFHQPEQYLTTQIGNGANISAITKLPVICDFRSIDLTLKGQGAPLVPIGDQLLFNAYDYCINLGGIANTSYAQNGQRIAFDICPVNIVLNKLANELGHPYDHNGDLAKSGKLDHPLLEQLNKLSFYQKSPPKSLGIEQIESTVLSLIQASPISTEDKLNTFITHISIQIGNTLKGVSKEILLTGGGALNAFLVKSIRTNTSNNIVLPSSQLIDFKEALIFAFLGVLRMRKEVNCLKSVTGATENSIGGCIYQAF